jgi:hypothetical protein
MLLRTCSKLFKVEKDTWRGPGNVPACASESLRFVSVRSVSQGSLSETLVRS